MKKSKEDEKNDCNKVNKEVKPRKRSMKNSLFVGKYTMALSLVMVRVFRHRFFC